MNRPLATTVRRHLDEHIDAARPLTRIPRPERGWVNAIRRALGMTEAQLAERMGITQSSLHRLESSEAAGTIGLDSLRRAAEALDCEVAYVLVPREQLEATVNAPCPQSRAHGAGPGLPVDGAGGAGRPDPRGCDRGASPGDPRPRGAVAQSLGDAYEDGQTPLDPDESEGLLLPVSTRAALNAVEADNIAEAVAWLASRRPPVHHILTDDFTRALHRRMFGRVWSWAGVYRRTDKNIGVPWPEVAVGVREILRDAGAWVSSGMEPDEAVVRLGHRVVLVHPFPNGNGRHSRLLSDCLAGALGRPAFTWGSRASEISGARNAYLAALRAADRGEIGPLVRFARG